MGEGEYTKRHNNKCKVIHWKILENFKLERSKYHWKHEPQKFIREGDIDIYYDKSITVGIYLERRHNKPDIMGLMLQNIGRKANIKN